MTIRICLWKFPSSVFPRVQLSISYLWSGSGFWTVQTATKCNYCCVVFHDILPLIWMGYRYRDWVELHVPRKSNVITKGKWTEHAFEDWHFWTTKATKATKLQSPRKYYPSQRAIKRICFKHDFVLTDTRVSTTLIKHWQNAECHFP